MDLDLFSTQVSKSRLGGFFHFTDNRNLPSIHKYGVLSHRRLAELGIVIAAPGGDAASVHTAVERGLDKYVSLCLKTGHPMEEAARKSARVQDVTYLAIHADIIKMPGVMMTDGMSNMNGIVPAHPGEVLDKLDHAVIYQWADWNHPDVQARLKIAEKFEILVPDHIPRNYILNL